MGVTMVTFGCMPGQPWREAKLNHSAFCLCSLDRGESYMELERILELNGSDTHRLRAKTFIRPMIGRSRPVLVEANDGNFYIVKTAGNLLYPNSLANEFLGSALSSSVGLPVAEPRKIELSRSFLGGCEHPGFYQDDTYPDESAIHYASRMVQTRGNEAFIFEGLSPNLVPFVRNKRDFLGMFVVDFCFKHADARQVIFVKQQGGPSSRAVFIDHGHMFGGPLWETDCFHRASFHPVIALYEGLSIQKDVCFWLKALSAKLPFAIDRAVKLLPSEWYTGDLILLQEWMHQRVQTLPRLIDQELERVFVLRKDSDATMHLPNSRVHQVGT